MKLYGLKNCDTCKKALNTLQNQGKDVEFIDIRSDERVSNECIEKWLSEAGQKKLINTRSTTWRNLSEEQKTIETNEQALQLLVDNPTLIKRPVIEDVNKVFVGWGKTEQEYFV